MRRVLLPTRSLARYGVRSAFGFRRDLCCGTGAGLADEETVGDGDSDPSSDATRVGETVPLTVAIVVGVVGVPALATKDSLLTGLS